MKKIFYYLIAITIIVCCTVAVTKCCDKACATSGETTDVVTGDKCSDSGDNCCAPAEEAEVASVQSTELIRTSQSWDGVELPDYFQGRPELVAVKYVFPAGKKLGWHHHPVMNYGILVQGELTIIGVDGQEKVVHEGEAVVEMVNTVHHGENRGTKPVILYMFYLSQKDLPLAVQHPEIPLE